MRALSLPGMVALVQRCRAAEGTQCGAEMGVLPVPGGSRLPEILVVGHFPTEVGGMSSWFF